MVLYSTGRPFVEHEVTSTDSFTPANNRSAPRNVHIYDVNDPATVLGGLILTDGVTNENPYSIICILDD